MEVLQLTHIYLIVFNILILFFLRKLAPRVNLIDIPGGRKTHDLPTPIIGGLSIYLTLIVAVAINHDWASDAGMIVCWAGLIVFVSCIDDIMHVSWPIRLIVQVVSSIGLVLSSGIKVTYIGTYPIIGPIELDHLSVAFTVFSIVGLINAYNLIDGIDGLFGTILLLPLLALMGISYWLSGKVDYYHFLIFSSLIIFLSLNCSKNENYKIFMGDAGSTGLSFIVAFFAIDIIETNKTILSPPLALWLFLIPISDMVLTVINRLIEKKSIFEASNIHIHHTLTMVNNSNNKSLLILGLVSLISIIIGVALNQLSDFTSLTIFIVTIIIISLVLKKLDKKSKLDNMYN